MLSMFAWTLMTATVVVIAERQYCPIAGQTCTFGSDLCGKEESGSCSPRCNCKNERMCSRDSDHTITVVRVFRRRRPVEERYYTCVALSGLEECSNQKALTDLVPETRELNSVEVHCKCSSPKVYGYHMYLKGYFCGTYERS
uniref:Conopeptide n=1 Tax=Conus lenavati TaxID=1519839 RepID=A0A0K8TTH5_CONLV